jgi:hypothetical protein
LGRPEWCWERSGSPDLPMPATRSIPLAFLPCDALSMNTSLPAPLPPCRVTITAAVAIAVEPCPSVGEKIIRHKHTASGACSSSSWAHASCCHVPPGSGSSCPRRPYGSVHFACEKRVVADPARRPALFTLPNLRIHHPCSFTARVGFTRPAGRSRMTDALARGPVPSRGRQLFRLSTPRSLCLLARFHAKQILARGVV